MSTPTPAILGLNGRMLFGGTVLALLVVVAALAPWLSPHDTLEQDLLST